MWQGGYISLERVGANPVERRIGEKKKKRDKKKGIGKRGSSFSLVFPRDPTVDICQSKRQSRSSQRELRVGTEIEECRQTPRGGGFSPTRFNLCLRVIQMVEVFGAGTDVHFNPKDLDLILDFWDCFRTFEAKNYGTVLGSLGTDFRTIIGPCVLFMCYY